MRKYVVESQDMDFGEVFVAQGHNDKAVAGGEVAGEQALQVGLQAQQLFFGEFRRREHRALHAATAVALEGFCRLFAQAVVFDVVADNVVHRGSVAFVFQPSPTISARPAA